MNGVVAEANVSGPAPFPRDGARQVLDDDRVTAWDYVWAAGPQGLRYRPARETVIVWLGAGRARMTHGDAATESDIKAGAATSATSSNAEAGKALIAFLSGSAAAPVLKAKGIEPR